MAKIQNSTTTDLREITVEEVQNVAGGAGTYTATAFVWESVDNPTARISPPVFTTITVR